MKARLKAMFAEFKEFAFKGNMIDLAVAVVLGAAFSGVINSLVKDIIMPSISYVTTAASQAGEMATHAAKNVATSVGGATAPTTGPATTQAVEAAQAPPATPAPAAPAAKPEPKAVDLSWRIGRIEIGHFLAELLNFILVAFAVFITVVKLLGSVMKRVSRAPKAEGPTTKECPRCLSLIPLRATKCAHCTADLPATPPTTDEAPAVS